MTARELTEDRMVEDELEEMSAGEEKKIVKRVRKILEKENLYKFSERQVREKASEKLGIDLSKEPYKSAVRRAVEDFLTEIKSQGIRPGIQSRLE